MKTLNVVFFICLFFTCNAFSQYEPNFNFDFYDQLNVDAITETDKNVSTEFIFRRGQYLNYLPGQKIGRGTWWRTDMPSSDKNFLRGLTRYTNIDVTPESYTSVDLASPEIFEHTFLYIIIKRVPINVPNSGPNFTQDEADNLREFMLRGGFVLIDDFWGEIHWDDFLIELAKIFPDRNARQIYSTHTIFHTFFDIDIIHQIPGQPVIWDYSTGYLGYNPLYPPSVYAVTDNNNNIMMIINHNMDLGDGWEHTFLEKYPTKFTNEAYKLGTNYIIYSLTH